MPSLVIVIISKDMHQVFSSYVVDQFVVHSRRRSYSQILLETCYAVIFRTWPNFSQTCYLFHVSLHRSDAVKAKYISRSHVPVLEVVLKMAGQNCDLSYMCSFYI